MANFLFHSYYAIFIWIHQDNIETAERKIYKYILYHSNLVFSLINNCIEQGCIKLFKISMLQKIYFK